jgi:hypothetical protein
MRYSRVQIEAILAQELERAETNWHWQKARFAEIVADISLGLRSDGVMRVKIAARRYNRSLRDYRTALNEFSAFATNLVVPDRFKQ